MNILETIVSHETVVPMKKLTDVTVEEDCSIYHLDLTGHTWAEHTFVLIRYIPADGGTSNELPVFINTNSGTYYKLSGGTSISSGAGLVSGHYFMPIAILLHTGRRSDNEVTGISIAGGRVFSSVTATRCKNITGLTFGNTNNPTLPMKAGSKIEIFGIL